jgi:Trp operon repressor
MPHLSRRTVSKKVEEALQKRIVSFINNTSAKTRREIFSELLTSTERLMLAKRLAIIHLLSKDETPYKISCDLRISASTVFRYASMVELGKFSKTTRWLGRDSAVTKILDLLADLAAIPFDARHKSLGKFIDEL